MMQPLMSIFLIISTVSYSVAQKGHHAQNTVELIRSRGFLCEMYVLETFGYPLTLYHVINPSANQSTINKYPVLYGHGVVFDSMTMISRSERSKPRKPFVGQPTINNGIANESDDYSLPFMFSNNNFDVWLFDARGTNPTNHKTSLIDEFWDFSLDEESLVDLPLIIDFVLKKTASKKLVYVGYSESTFFMFALLSTAPNYSDKIAALVAMAPVTYLTSIRGLTVPMIGPVATVVPDFIHVNVLPQITINLINRIIRNLCRVQDLSSLLCSQLANSLGGIGVGEHSPDFFAEFYKSTSLKAFKQFIQLFVSKRFGMYDYGPKENMKRYGQTNPPDYDLARITTDKLILVRGMKDFLSTPEDQDLLIKQLKVKPYLDIVLPHYNHFDFIDGKDLIRLVNEPVITAVYALLYKDGPDILVNQEHASTAKGSLTLNSKFGQTATEPILNTTQVKRAETLDNSKLVKGILKLIPSLANKILYHFNSSKRK